MDDRDVVFSEARFNEIVGEVNNFIKRRKLDIKHIFVPISAVGGDNIRDKSEKTPWLQNRKNWVKNRRYQGGTLLEEIDRLPITYKADSPLWATVVDVWGSLADNELPIYVHSGTAT